MPVTERDLSHEVKAYNRTNNKTSTTNSKTITTSNSSSTSSSKSPKKRQKTTNSNSSSIQTLIKIDSKQPFDLSTSAFTIAAERCILYNSISVKANVNYTSIANSIDEQAAGVCDSDNGHNSDPFESGECSTGILGPTSSSSSSNHSNDTLSRKDDHHNSDPTTQTTSVSPFEHSVDYIDLTPATDNI